MARFSGRDVGRICCTGEMFCSLLLSQVFLNLGSGDSKFHDKLSKQGSAIKYADRFNSEMKEVIMEVIMEAMYVEVWDGS